MNDNRKISDSANQALAELMLADSPYEEQLMPRLVEKMKKEGQEAAEKWLAEITAEYDLATHRKSPAKSVEDYFASHCE